MIIDTEVVRALMKDENLTGYSIEKETGYSRQQISNLRTGKQSIMSLSVINASTLQNFYLTYLQELGTSWFSVENLKANITEVTDEIITTSVLRRASEQESIMCDTIEELHEEIYTRKADNYNIHRDDVHVIDFYCYEEEFYETYEIYHADGKYIFLYPLEENTLKYAARH